LHSLLGLRPDLPKQNGMIWLKVIKHYQLAAMTWGLHQSSCTENC